MAEKTEKATPKKLKDARKKGQVAKSQDFPSVFTFLVSIFGTLFSAGYLYDTLSSYLVQTFRAIGNPIDLEHRGGLFFTEAIQVIFTASFPILIIVTFVGVLVNFLIVGPMFSMEALKFDLKKLNPVEGIKQKFKLKVLIELLKSIFKIAGASIIIFFVIKRLLPEIVISSRLSAYGSALIIADFLKSVSIQVGIFFLAIAIFDLVFQRRTFAKEMMMEKFEVKQEYKDTEGDPHIKWKRKDLFREIAYSEGPSATRKARAIVTNPTHLAIAIGYDSAAKETPKILTMGQGPMAEAIIKIAVEENIPIMRNVPLAHQLFSTGVIGQYIPKDTYEAIATILKWIETMEQVPGLKLEMPQ